MVKTSIKIVLLLSAMVVLWWGGGEVVIMMTMKNKSKTVQIDIIIVYRHTRFQSG